MLDFHKLDPNKDYTKEEKSRRLPLQYSNEPDRLEAWMSDPRNSVKIRFCGLVKHAFCGETMQTAKLRPHYQITVETALGFHVFDYWGSINDAEIIEGNKLGLDRYKHHEEQKKIIDGLLYSALCCIRSESYCPSDFSDFCSELEYDEDSRNAFSTWEELLKFSKAITKIIPYAILSAMPS